MRVCEVCRTPITGKDALEEHDYDQDHYAVPIKVTKAELRKDAYFLAWHLLDSQIGQAWGELEKRPDLTEVIYEVAAALRKKAM